MPQSNQILNSSLDLKFKSFLEEVLKDVMYALSAECGSLFIFDAGHKELILDSFLNSCNLRIKGLKKRVGEGVSGKVADINKPVLVKNIKADARFRSNGYKHYKTASFMSIPIITSKGLIGLINIADKSNKEPFSESDLKFAVAIVKYAVMLLEASDSCSELKSEKECLGKEKELLTKYASVGKLAAGVVHEINNPLDGIIRFTNILIEQIENNSVSKEYLLEVKNGLSRIAKITKSLYEFSHIVNVDSLKTREYVYLNDMLDEPLKVYAEKIMNGNIQIKKKFNAGSIKVVDFGLQHVFSNLIKNALDSIQAVGIIEISTELHNDTVKIGFKDSGTGIPSEILGHIFEPFFTTKPVGKGTGLGLSICREIINKYEGKIDVSSAVGDGSNFTVTINRKYTKNA
ncbi:MAG: GAF domain-containing protein [Candidatus Omnitrophota bacterium]|jgi:K+-sensing histidine kinase KdpD|nr:MAG: GAF domain-containing protein [Candidatus Omnitrophota bacterium]